MNAQETVSRLRASATRLYGDEKHFMANYLEYMIVDAVSCLSKQDQARFLGYFDRAANILDQKAVANELARKDVSSGV